MSNSQKIAARLCSNSFNEYLNHEFFAELSWRKLRDGRLSLECEGIDNLCITQSRGGRSPAAPKDLPSEKYLNFSDQKVNVALRKLCSETIHN